MPLTYDEAYQVLKNLDVDDDILRRAYIRYVFGDKGLPLSLDDQDAVARDIYANYMDRANSHALLIGCLLVTARLSATSCKDGEELALIQDLISFMVREFGRVFVMRMQELAKKDHKKAERQVMAFLHALNRYHEKG